MSIGKTRRVEDIDPDLTAVPLYNGVLPEDKIVFTDGHPAPGTMPDESTKGVNVIWLVYGKRSFDSSYKLPYAPGYL